jgi:CheY-like chemotaxis protein
MGGLEAAQRIRAMERQGKCSRCFIVGITADDDPEVPDDATDAGMDCFMSKPFRVNMFIDILEQQGQGGGNNMYS